MAPTSHENGLAVGVVDKGSRQFIENQFGEQISSVIGNVEQSGKS